MPNSGSDVAALYGDAPVTQDFKGQDFGFLQNLLKMIIGNNGQLPGQDKIRQNAFGQIDLSTDNAVKKTQENLSATGLGRSGVGVSALNGIYAGGSMAKSGVESDLANQSIQNKENAIAKLLGLNAFGGSQDMQTLENQRNYGVNIGNLWDQNSKIQALKDATPSPWMQLLGSVIGGAGQLGAAAIMSDKKLKKNIKGKGKTESGLPISEWTYKGDESGTRYRGHLAQDVEKKYPNAVFKVIDYNKMPKDAIFEVLNG